MKTLIFARQNKLIMGKTVIVTGANGYLGTYVCRELLGKGYSVIGLKYDHYASTIIDDPGITYLYCDITQEIEPQIGGEIAAGSIDALINTAALLGSSDYDRNYAVNAGGVDKLISFCRTKGIRRFIQISSVVVMKEFKGPYGETKLIGQQFLESSGLDHTVFIPAMILGPEGLGINRILKNVYRLPFIVPLVGYGRQTQHPIFVEDFARCIVKSIDIPVCIGKNYEIAGDSIIPFRDFIAMILKIRGSRKFFIPVPPAIVKLMGKGFQRFQSVPLFTAEHVKGVLQDSALDTRLIRQDLDFEPTPLKDALKHCLEIIGTDWDRYLSPREEITIKIKD